MTWKPETVKTIGDARVEYLRARHHHEGAYDVHIGDETLRVLPGSDATTRTRLGLVQSALGDILDDRHDPMLYLIGVMVAHGERNLELDGQPLLDGTAAEFRIQITAAGNVRVVHDGGGS